ncbi:MAG: hypothetical protein SFY80_15480 [Verrucomicrobiota bacterium]|nr:hypothetical protein [Verrucomicrobiota bacterium]
MSLLDNTAKEVDAALADVYRNESDCLVASGNEAKVNRIKLK